MMEASWLPAPLHMAPSFLAFGALEACGQARHRQGAARDYPDRRQAAGRGGRYDARLAARMKQTPGAIDRFWRVVLVSALDEELGRTDARYGIDVFWKAFLAQPRRIPNRHSVGAARRAVRRLPRSHCRRGGGVRMRAAFARFACAKANSSAAVLEDGSEISADACISAVPHSVLLTGARRTGRRGRTSSRTAKTSEHLPSRASISGSTAQ